MRQLRTHARRCSSSPQVRAAKSKTASWRDTAARLASRQNTARHRKCTDSKERDFLWPTRENRNRARTEIANISQWSEIRRHVCHRRIERRRTLRASVRAVKRAISVRSGGSSSNRKSSLPQIKKSTQLCTPHDEVRRRAQIGRAEANRTFKFGPGKA